MTFPNFEIELNLLKQGHNFVAGLDEAGRGPLAGPIVASAVILPSQFLLSNLPKLNDSKKLSPKVREELHIEIKKIAVSVGIGIVEVEIVDKIGIGKANKLAFLKAIINLNTPPTFIVTDYLKLNISDISLLKLIKVPNLIDLSALIKNQKNITHGDAISSSIAAASVIAKVHRDNIMNKLHLKYPQYGFDKHKGYGTKTHLNALKIHGPCEIHRKSFSPIQQLNIAP